MPTFPFERKTQSSQCTLKARWRDVKMSLFSAYFFASRCIDPKERGGRGLPAKVVQDLLGHSSITVTLDTCGHLFPRGGDRAELAKASRLLLA
jgi:hypothetical protein